MPSDRARGTGVYRVIIVESKQVYIKRGIKFIVKYSKERNVYVYIHARIYMCVIHTCIR